MKRQIEQWTAIGATDPYWGVLADPARKHGGWRADEFYATGEREIEAVFARLAALGFAEVPAVALDFGCGVGRLTRALARRCGEVVGVDVSEPMLAKATAEVPASNVRFVLNQTAGLSFLPDRSVDFIYSNIVLQHLGRREQRRYITEFCRVLAAGGVMIFQVPSHPRLTELRGVGLLVLPTFALNLRQRIVHGPDHIMEMHWLRRTGVERLLAGCGIELLACDDDQSAGPALVSYRYIARRPARTRLVH